MRATLLRFLLLALFVTGCASASADALPSGEGIEELTVPQVEVPGESELPKPFQGKIIVYGEKPVLYRGNADSWDSSLVNLGAIIYQDGLYHMFYNGIKIEGSSGNGGIGYAISTNGYDWYRVANEPLLTWDETVGAELWVRASSVFVDESGIWTLYLSSYRRTLTEESPAIYRATASAPNGPWVFDSVPLLEAGSSGTWDDVGVGNPVVLPYNGNYLMYYNNVRYDSQRGFSGIGLATSEDGLVWEKHNDPATDDKFEESDPVFRLPEDSQPSILISAASVWQDTLGLNMIYNAGPARSNKFYYATSPDGIVWTPTEENPLLSEEDISYLEYISAPRLFHHDGKFFIYFYGSSNSGVPQGDIYLAVEE